MDDLRWSKVKEDWRPNRSLQALVCSVLPSLTLLLVFIPGAQLYSLKSKWASLLLSQSSRMVGMNIRITACEATFESLLQLSLQLFIIFLRSDTLPSALQIVTILTSLFMVSVGASEDFLTSMMNKETELNKKKGNVELKYYSELSFQARGQKLARCLPFYIFLTIFRVMSFSLVLVVLGFYSIVLYFALLSILLLGFFFSILTEGNDTKPMENLKDAMEEVRRTRQEQGLIYFFMLPFRTILSTGLSDIFLQMISHTFV